MELGTATAATGERAEGWLPVTELPTDSDERLPVVLCNGSERGDTVWITASVHGDEVVGLAVARDVATRLDPTRVSGRVVIVPTLNPAGLRRTVRRSYYDDEDPNRTFPDPVADPTTPPSVQERIGERVYTAFTETLPADYLLDLHTAGAGAVPFAIRDRVLFGELRSEADAETLADDLTALATGSDLPVVTEYPADLYTEKSLQRSTAGAALNGAGIPALTLELGEHRHVRRDHHAVGMATVYRLLAHAGVVEAVPDDVDAADPGVDAPVDYPVRRYEGPRAEKAGIVRHLVTPGDEVTNGDRVADVTTLHGEVLDRVTSDHDGYVLSHREGAIAYENEPVCSMAIRDDGPLIAPRAADE